MRTFLLNYIGDKEFYLKTFRVTFPLAMTMLLTSCMSIIDSIMVSSIGMVTAVGNATQIITLSNGISWGITSGIAIFAAQFFGAKQFDKMGKTLGLSIILSLINALIWILVSYLFPDQILLFYLDDLEVLEYSRRYLQIVVLAEIPLALNNSIGIMYRSEHNTKLTFIISLFGAIFNIFFNYLFIFVLDIGVEGAAIGTLIAQSLVFLIYVFYIIKDKPSFILGIENFKLPLSFVKPIFARIIPLIINETLFGFGMTLFVKAFGLLGTQSMDAYYVANQIFNLFLFLVHGYGSAVSILIGTRLGQGRIELAKQEAKYQLGLGAMLAGGLIIFIIIFKAPLLELYNVQDMNTYIMCEGLLNVFAFKVFMRMFNFMMFSTLKAGGDASILNFLDSGIMYLVGIPIAFISILIFKIDSIVIVLLLCQIEQVVRFILTYRRYRTGTWANDLTKSMV